MKRLHLALLAIVVLAGCGRGERPPLGKSTGYSQGQPDQAVSLTEARRGFKTKLAPLQAEKDAAPTPPPRLFRTVQYEAPVGKLSAYLTPDPKDGK